MPPDPAYPADPAAAYALHAATFPALRVYPNGDRECHVCPREGAKRRRNARRTAPARPAKRHPVKVLLRALRPEQDGPVQSPADPPLIALATGLLLAEATAVDVTST